MRIPDLSPMYEAVRDLVKENQGDKGYIDCQPSLGCDIIYGMMYDDDYGAGTEQYVYGVRVIDDELEVLLEPIMRTYRVVYKDEDFMNSDNENKWYSLRWSDVYYVPTIFNIAECIQEYV